MPDKMFGKIKRLLMNPSNIIDGIIVIDKPKGVTSFDVVAKVRRAIGQRRVGHAGTLDPNVDGVLVVALGKATKLIDELQTRPKRYIGEITLGFATESEDLDGEVVEETTITTPFSNRVIDEAIAELQGHIKQTPPMFSAVKVNGKRLYEYARAGEIVDRPIRDAIIYNFKRTSDVIYVDQRQLFNFEATVSKGTYIRTLAVDVGKKIGVPATMTSLTRTMGSGITQEDAITLESLKTLSREELLQHIISIQDILTWPIKSLSDDEWFAVKNGQKISQWEPSNDYLQLVYHGELKAVYAYDREQNVWRSRYVFTNE